MISECVNNCSFYLFENILKAAAHILHLINQIKNMASVKPSLIKPLWIILYVCYKRLQYFMLSSLLDTNPNFLCAFDLRIKTISPLKDVCFNISAFSQNRFTAYDTRRYL